MTLPEVNCLKGSAKQMGRKSIPICVELKKIFQRMLQRLEVRICGKRSIKVGNVSHCDKKRQNTELSVDVFWALCGFSLVFVRINNMSYRVCENWEGDEKSKNEAALTPADSIDRKRKD